MWFASIDDEKSLETEEEKIDAVTKRSRSWFRFYESRKEKEIASKGGKAAHALGTAHKWTSEEAQAAGRKGGSISRRRSKYNVQA